MDLQPRQAAHALAKLHASPRVDAQDLRHGYTRVAPAEGEPVLELEPMPFVGRFCGVRDHIVAEREPAPVMTRRLERAADDRGDARGGVHRN